MPNQSPIFIKTEVFMLWLMQHTSKFARHERFRLAQHIDNAIFAFHECLVRAAHAENPREQLLEADVHLDRLRAYLRLAVELQHTSPSQYQHAAIHTTELGKLLGGWLKTR